VSANITSSEASSCLVEKENSARGDLWAGSFSRRREKGEFSLDEGVELNKTRSGIPAFWPDKWGTGRVWAGEKHGASGHQRGERAQREGEIAAIDQVRRSLKMGQKIVCN